ncbi:helix-turn-helix domain-containing protein [Pelagimonas varians]|uniref:Bifunctional transcriptional activator/DNA repair enzyme AdaA n=1 Tax=Pelagimonas varians TaxID=696760 RepID=A0A238K8Y0_9RHOB|nr:AraC family transcriptional regulator [Pelagimonas varians]PYG31604.1 AraC family transcriptional regulator [Pelagimonas varians]SMX38947.1 Bifunctional transcriptional activator/DNA repair enzyme AdaA [Pelagimonas varians]
MKRPGFLSKPMPPAPMLPSQVSRAASDEPLRCGSFALLAQSAPWRYSLLHDQPNNLLLWITRGQGVVNVNGVRRGISMHNALFLPAGTLFAFDLPKTVQALMIQSPAGLTNRMPREPLLLRIRDGLAQAELTGHIDAMGRETLQDRPLLNDAMQAYAKLVAIWLHRQVQTGAVDVPSDTAAARLTRRFAQHVARGYRNPMTIADYAQTLDVTPTHLTRVCRKSCGKTAAEILAERKMHAAWDALTTSKQPIKKIASDLSFTSAAYFTRFVQVQTGETPSKLRRQSKPETPR